MQIAQPTGEDSAAYAAGFRTVADICLARVSALEGMPFRQVRLTGAATGGADKQGTDGTSD